MRPATTHVALLRAVNVGGRKPVAMPQLRELLAGLGFVEPRGTRSGGGIP